MNPNDDHSSEEAPTREPENLEDYFAQCEKEADSLPQYRGIRRDTLTRFRFGLDKSWTNPALTEDGKFALPSARAIIPTGPASYLARALDPEDPLPILKVGPVQLFNAKCIEAAKTPIYVVEGEIDAMSICDIGGEAVGLGSASNGHLLVDYIKEHRPSQPLILAFDWDEDPKTRGDVWKLALRLADQLDALGIPHMLAPPELYTGCKDANELLQQNRAALEKAVRQTAMTASLHRGPYETAASELPAFLRYVDDQRRRTPILTGFPRLDEALGGGLFGQLYVLGAQSSLGKSTLTLQIADQLSAAGIDVIYYSLEMSARFLQAKSLSRTSYLLDGSEEKDNSIDANSLLRGKWLDGPEASLLRRAMEAYRSSAAHLILREGFGGLSISEIEQDLQAAARYGIRPVIVVDYLQIMQPPTGETWTEKQLIDYHIRRLWELAGSYDVPVLCISSLNRGGYDEPVVPGSFKESGGIEYTADVLMGMQYHGVDYQEGEKPAQHQARVRDLIAEQKFLARQGGYQDLDIKILKNRYCPPATVQMRFNAKFNHFTDDLAEETIPTVPFGAAASDDWDDWLDQIPTYEATEAPSEEGDLYDVTIDPEIGPYVEAAAAMLELAAQFPLLRNAEADEGRVAEALKIFDSLELYLRDVTMLTALSEARARRALNNLGCVILPDGKICR